MSAILSPTAQFAALSALVDSRRVPPEAEATRDYAAAEKAMARARAEQHSAIVDARSDGVTYALVEFDNATKLPKISHEPAWDGDSGMIAIWDRTLKFVIAAAKIWWERDERRMNVYTDRKVTKYVERDGKVEQAGSPDDIRNHPANEYVERFVARRT